jgi:simple sugar transport system ATP-binding protein
VTDNDSARPDIPGAALRLQAIEKAFGGIRALNGASLSLRSGTVHAVLGENGAGKTTLMRIAYGLIQPDGGQIFVHDREVRFRSPAAAIRHGIGMVHQHFTAIGRMTVAENIALGSRGLFSREQAAARVRALEKRTGLALDPNAQASTLAIGAQQRLEILKVLAHDARILIMDEPTAVLAPAESEDLLRWLRAFADAGGSVVLITHKLREALSVSDDITVLRYGRTVLTTSSRGAVASELARAMLGAAPPPPPAAELIPSSRVVLRVTDLTLRDERNRSRIDRATFELRSGEILGIVALENSGHQLLLRAVARRIPPLAGRIESDGPVAFIPEDRQRDAIVMSFPLTENVALKGSGVARGRMRWSIWRARTQALMRDFDVRAPSPNVAAKTLSGGNQQKLVLGRELADAPSLVVAENPTRGLDIRATADIHNRLRLAAVGGAGVVLYSSDLDEVLTLATTVVAVHAGKLRTVPNDRESAGRAMLGLP